MHKILFIVPAYFNNSPRSIRFRQLISYLKHEYEVHVITMTNNINKNIREMDGVYIHELPYTTMSKLFKLNNVRGRTKSKGGIIKNKGASPEIIKNIFRFMFYSVLFPDSMIVEYFNIKRYLKHILKVYNYRWIVASIMPHTNYLYGKVIKKSNPEIMWICDIGDPLYKNAIKKIYRHQTLAKWFESKYVKYMDKLVVTNTTTKQYYVNTYRSIKSHQVDVVPQGGNDRYKKLKYKIHFDNDIKMIYAGGFYPKLREPGKLYQALEKISEFNINLDLFGEISEIYIPQNYKLKNKVSHKGSIPHEELLKKYQDYDIIVYIDNAYGMQTSGKIYEILSTGVPILFIYNNRNSEMLKITKDSPLVTITENDSDNIIKAIYSIIDNYNKYNYISHNTKEYSWEERAERYKNILK